MATPTLTPTKRRNLRAELNRTQARLAELEATLEAIRNGEVDGIVVDGPNGSRVFSLQSPDEPYRILAERMNEGAATLTGDGTVLFCNGRLSEMVGMPIERIAGSAFRLLLTEEGQKQFPELLEQALKTQVRAEASLALGAGTKLPVQLSMSQIPFEELGIGVCLLVTDLTEQKRAEANVRELNAELEARVVDRTRALVAANQELETFSYAIAHDLRAPLRHIHGFSEILAKDSQSSLSADGQHCVDAIVKGVSRMEELVTELLNLSRIARQPLVLQATDLSVLVREVIEQLGPEVAGRQVEWRVRSLPLWNCDSSLIRAVFTNLLSNALKFTRGRTPAMIEIGQIPAEPQTAVFVKDNGVGFDPRFAERLFGMFQRLHKASEFEGEGVGLATVYRIVHKHGGRVWADAKPDEGAVFYFTLGRTAR